MPTMIRKVFGNITKAANNRDYDISLRAYILIAFSGIFYALAISVIYFIAGTDLLINAFFFFATAVALSLLLWYSLRSGKYFIGALFSAIWMTAVFFPFTFFLGGGVKGGASVWFIISFAACALILKGKLGGLFIGINTVSFIICFAGAYFHPELVKDIPEFMEFLDSLMAVFVVGWLVAIMIYYQENICRREKEIFEAQKDELDILNRSQQDFFSNMSRRIRTPITTITGLNEITLKNESIPEDVAKNTMNIYSACRMLLSLVDDILDLNKIHAGNLEVAYEKYETAKLFADVFSMLGGRAKENGLELRFDISPDFPAWLYGDEVRIKQVLVNIVTNAIKYTREGSVTIKARGETREGIFYSEYDVIDTGIGIKEEDLKKLFTDYRRLDLQENRGVEGTGLGLSIVKLFTELMGGSVSAQSVYKKGSDFKVTIPQKTAGSETIGSFDISTINTIGSGRKASFASGKGRVLVVDDDDMNRLVVKKLLQDTGVAVEEASGGSIALDFTREYSYDIIFMDHMMPGMDGPETLRRIRSQIDGRCKEVPVVALTANAGSDIEEYYNRLGFDGYLAKPIDGKLLEDYVKDVVSEDGERKILKKDRKIPFMITTDSVANIPKEEAERLGIGVLSGFVRTDKGIRLKDNEEIMPMEVKEYFKQGRGSLLVELATEEETESFFIRMKKKADHIIHISLPASFKGGNHKVVTKVAKRLGGITVVDSGLVHTGQGLLALVSAKIVQSEQNSDRILEYIKEKRDLIEYRTIIKNNSGMGQNVIFRIMGYFGLYSSVIAKNGRISGRAFIKGSESVFEDFVKKVLSEEGITDEVLFIGYSGMSEKQLEHIKNGALERKGFRSVYAVENTASILTRMRDDNLALAFIRKRS